MMNYKEYSNFFVIPRSTDGKLINGSYNRVWKTNKVIGTINVCNVLMVGEKENMDKINVIGNYMPSGHDASRIVDENGLAPTVKENHGTITATMTNLRIRKLTPKECWRLMVFDDSDFEKAAQVNSNTQLYKQAGNSIVVNVLEAILGNLLI